MSAVKDTVTAMSSDSRSSHLSRFRFIFGTAINWFRDHGMELYTNLRKGIINSNKEIKIPEKGIWRTIQNQSNFHNCQSSKTEYKHNHIYFIDKERPTKSGKR